MLNTKVISSIFHDKIFQSEEEYLQNVATSVIPFVDNYDFVMYVRIDFYLKNYFIDNVTFDTYKIIFPFIDSNINLSNPLFSVCHSIMIIPAFYYDKMKDGTTTNGHFHLVRSRLLTSGVPHTHVGFIVNTLHVCSTDLGWNPIFIQVGRNYKSTYTITDPCCSTIEHYYDEISNSFKHDPSTTIARWCSELHADTLEEQLMTISGEF